MKNFKNAFIITLIGLFLWSCDEDLLIFSNDGFVQLEETVSATVIENSGESVSITAILGSPQASPTVVTFDITGTAESSRFTLTPGASISIPAGESSGTVLLTPIDNEDIDGDVDVILTLSTSSGLPIGIGGEGLESVSKTITIVDDNVPCNDYVLTVLTDAFPQETTWQITDTDGVIVHSGGEDYGPPSSAASRLKEYIEQVPLEDGCYTFTIFDAFGDGLDDGVVQGSWVLGCGALVVSSGVGNFGSSSSTDFCVNL